MIDKNGYLTKEKYDAMIDKFKWRYWEAKREARWEYMSFVIDRLKEFDLNNICEAGASLLPLHSGSFLITQNSGEQVTKRGIIHDLNKIPYPILDKEFDCFVALQVWEHLINQRDAFKEVMRISRMAVMSFPLNWQIGDYMHLGITHETIRQWTLYEEPLFSTIITEEPDLQRLICFWRFD